MLFDPNWKPKTKGPVIKRKDLTKREIKMLLQVRKALADGTISAKQFRMDTIVDSKPRCGTYGCIGGWMGILAMRADGYSSRKINKMDEDNPVWEKYFGHMERNGLDSKFTRLFYPTTDRWTPCKYDLDKESTPEDAIKAIDNFLAGEEYPWKDWKEKGE